MKVEFIIPTYKSYSNLITMIGSIMSQTSPDWILTIISDGDDDFINHDQIKLIRQINDPRIDYRRIAGPNNDWGHTARNYGLDKAKGDWIVMSASDNYYVPTFVEHIIHEAQNPDVSLIYCDFIHNLAYGGYRVIQSQIKAGHIDIGNVAYKRELIGDARLDKKEYTADFWFAHWYNNLHNNVGGKIARKIDKVLYVHN